MSWIQYKLAISDHELDALEQALELIGCEAISIEAQDPKLMIFEQMSIETPLWPELVVTLLFAEQDLTQLEERLKEALSPSQFAQRSMARIEDKDWQMVWRESFKPLNFNDKLWICPTWLKSPAPDATLYLDPGLAFGTGSHASTHLCLDWLVTRDLVGQSVLDYGCGSGILALSAHKLGAHTLAAVDCDPQALEVTQANQQINHMLDAFDCYLPGDLPQALQVDVLLANILAQPLIELAAQLQALVKPGGYIVLAGLLNSQAAAVQAAYAPWFDAFEHKKLDEWSRLSARRRSAS